MPWITPTLRNVRELVRGEITTSLGRASFIGNSVLRVLADAQAALTHLVLKYIDWISLQLMPDTAEKEWLDRHGDIWLTNADGSTGRKAAGLANGTVTLTGILETIVPTATQFTDDTTTYETTEQILLGNGPNVAKVVAIDPGVVGNHIAGDILNLTSTVSGLDEQAIVIDVTGGTDVETDDQLRDRVLRRIRQPPMGGAAYDYEAWALAVPGVTRAWCAPLEMGIGTVSVRFMMDDLRAQNDGFPTGADVHAVDTYLDTVKPVAVKDIFVVAPIPQRVDVYIQDLVLDNTSIRTEVEKSLKEMLFRFAAPGQTIFAAWKYSAIMSTQGVVSFHLRIHDDDLMQSPGHMAVLGDVVYGNSPK